MKVIRHKAGTYLIRFDRGENFIESFSSFCEDQQIGAGSFAGLGACDKLSLSWYDLDAKEYRKKAFNDNLEIASLTGNISYIKEKLFVHAHGVFAGKDYQAIAGHVNELRVSGTLEIKLDVFNGEIQRAYDEETGLSLMG